MTNNNKDYTLDNLLALDGERFIIDEKHGLWVKFEAKETSFLTRKSGVRYSLTLHNREGKRLLGFDNAHPVEFGGKNKVAPSRIYEHFHDEKENIHPYFYQNAAQLIEDFWLAVENLIQTVGEGPL